MPVHLPLTAVQPAYGVSTSVQAGTVQPAYGVSTAVHAGTVPPPDGGVAEHVDIHKNVNNYRFRI